ncbi:putative reverse transcriptase domain-containing protein [Tanacetum coccineum]
MGNPLREFWKQLANRLLKAASSGSPGRHFSFIRDCILSLRIMEPTDMPIEIPRVHRHPINVNVCVTAGFGNDGICSDSWPMVIINWDDTIISRVYYVEGLKHNLFSVGQFCDGGLEVAFRQHSCHIRNYDMVDLLKGSRSTNLYSISLNDMLSASPVCLLTKASSRRLVWHSRLKYRNFGTLNELARKNLVRGFPMLKYAQRPICVHLVDDLFQWFDDDEVVPIPPVVPISPVHVPAAPAPENANGSTFSKLLEAFRLFIAHASMKEFVDPWSIHRMSTASRKLSMYSNKLHVRGYDKLSAITVFSKSRGIFVNTIPNYDQEILKVCFDLHTIDTPMAEAKPTEMPPYCYMRTMAGCHDTRRCTLVQLNFLDHRLVSGSIQKAEKFCHLTTEAESTRPYQDTVSNSLDAFSNCGYGFAFNKIMMSKGRTVADSITERLTRPNAYKVKTDCSIIPVWVSIHTVIIDLMESEGTIVWINRIGPEQKKLRSLERQDKSSSKVFSLIPLSRGSFDVIVGMDWLSKRKFVIVCHEKVVRIPLEGDEILQVHGERTQGVVKTLMNTKVEFRIDLVHGATSVAKSPYCLAPLEMQELEAWSPFEVSVGITEEGEVVTYLRFIANFSKIVKPITSLTERDQKYEWGVERKEAFQTLKNDLCDASINRMYKYEYEIRYHPGKANVVADALSRKERLKPRRVRAMAMTIQTGMREKIQAAQSEALKQENVLAESLHGLDQQMEKKEDESLYFMDRVWVPLVGGVRTVIMDEAHKSKYPMHPGADKMYHDLRDMYWWPRMKRDIATYVSKKENTDKVVLIKEKLKAARDRQKSYVDNRPYRLKLPEELSGVHDTFHVSNLKKCLADASLHVPLDEIKFDKTLCFVEEPIEIMDREVMSLKSSKIVLVKVRWNSKRGLEFTWEREDYMKSKYPQLFVELADESAS